MEPSRSLPSDSCAIRIRRIDAAFTGSPATFAILAAAIRWCRAHSRRSNGRRRRSSRECLLFIPYESLARPGEIFPLLVPGWTLNYEMFFYALFALSLLLSSAWRIPVMLSALACLVVAGRVLHPSSPVLSVYTDPRLLEFGFGMVAGRLWIASPRELGRRQFPVFLALGDASYSIYLSHLFTLGALRVIWVRVVPHASLASSVAFMTAALIICAAAGWLCYRFVERPITVRWR